VAFARSRSEDSAGTGRGFNFIDHRPGIRSGCIISATAVSDRVTAVVKEAVVKLTMHTLRKWFGCRYAGKESAQVLQKLMRHSHIRTTMDEYANVDDAVMRAVLGSECNTSRNTQPEPTQNPKKQTPQPMRGIALTIS
jgi:integrase